MFAEPISVDLGTGAVNLAKIRQGATDSTYFVKLAGAEGNLSLRISHQQAKKRTRRMVRLDQESVASDALSGTNYQARKSVYLVVDFDPAQETASDVGGMITALAEFLATAGTVAKLVNGES